jgi:hypothetical protein
MSVHANHHVRGLDDGVGLDSRRLRGIAAILGYISLFTNYRSGLVILLIRISQAYNPDPSDLYSGLVGPLIRIGQTDACLPTRGFRNDQRQARAY